MNDRHIFGSGEIFVEKRILNVDYFIEYFREDSISGRFLKGRKFSRNKMNELILEKEKRDNNKRQK